MSKTLIEPNFETGIYSFPAVARVLRHRQADITSQRVRYWVKTGLSPASFGRGASGSDLLSFFDLVSLEIVRRLRLKGVSLQKVRELESKMRQRYPQTHRPFALEVFFTDGSTIWHQLHPDDDAVVEVVGTHPEHAAWRPVVRSFADEVRYNDQGVAVAWRPSEWVEMDPTVRFGAPVVAGTRILLSTIEADLEAGTTEKVAEWHGLEVAQVEDVRLYLSSAQT